jgi:ArsR family transcriptional regulator
MLHMLTPAAQPICVCDFAAAFELHQPTVSHNLARLRRAGLVTSFRKGTWTCHRLTAPLPVEARAVVALVP